MDGRVDGSDEVGRGDSADERVPAGADFSEPSIARMYDYYLGGKDNFAADREAADKLLAVGPEIATIARENRAFLGRAVRFLADAGIRQFIDIGTGLPTQDNVHQVAQAHVPEASVVYVDNDPVVLTHARALLADNPNTVVVDADLRQPASIIDNPEVRSRIDFDRPMAVLMVAILHFFSDDDGPFELVDRFREAMPSGSYLALSHVVSEGNPEAISEAQEIYRSFLRRTGDARRTREDVARFFDGLDLLDPGLVYLAEWRPDDGGDAEGARGAGGVGGAGDDDNDDDNGDGDGSAGTLPPESAWIVGGVARKP